MGVNLVIYEELRVTLTNFTNLIVQVPTKTLHATHTDCDRVCQLCLRCYLINITIFLINYIQHAVVLSYTYKKTFKIIEGY